ncbi:MAG: serine/threonine protein kinase [Myxococcota bacterium]
MSSDAAESQIRTFAPSGESARILKGRYDVLEELGRGGQGVTFRAIDQNTRNEVVVKELAIGGLDDWKSLELFEREAEILNDVSHPRVPEYIDSFELPDEHGETRRFLVREFVDGESVREMIDRGRHFKESEALEIARQILELMAFLHALDPPIIHRDIKPSNLIVDDVGRVFLVDFGVAQAAVPETVGGSTVVGTAGFLPPEQLSGRSSAVSDLYALGATLVYMLSFHHPATLDVHRLKLQFRAVTPVSGQFSSFLDQLLEPDATRRLGSAREAIGWLEDKGLLSSDRRMAAALGMEAHAITTLGSDGLPPLPEGSDLEVSHTPEQVVIDVPIQVEQLWPNALAVLAGLAMGAAGFATMPASSFVGGFFFLVSFFTVGLGFPRFSPRRLTLTRRELRVESRWAVSPEFTLPLKDFYGLCIDDSTRRRVRSKRFDEAGGFSLVGARDEREALAVVWRDPELSPLDVLNPIKIRRLNDSLSIMERRWLIEVLGRWEDDEIY